MNFTTETFLGNLCRACMEKKKYKTISIFNETDRIEDNNLTVMELLLLTTPQLNIEMDDVLPKVLCENCLDRLINVHKFQQMCIRVEEKLRQMFNERVTLDPLSKNVAVNDFKNISEINEQLPDSDVQLVDNKKSDEKEEVKYETEEKQWNSDSSVPNENNISEDSEWGFHTINVSKTKLGKSSSSSPKNIKHKLKDKKKVHGNSKNDENKKNFVCDECGSHLKTQNLLTRHKKVHLNSSAGQDSNRRTGRFECEICKKIFQQSRTLKQHERTHTGEQPYLCSECGKAFNNLRNMQQHLLRHSTVRQYECPYCPKRFRCISDLAAHKTVHNKKRPHVCDVCGSGFAIPYLLKKHKMYHTGERNYKCDFCEMRFFAADHCRRHMRTHTGEKPYKCKYCDRAFAQSNDMIKHLRVHLGDNVYKCDLCPQGYRLQRDLRAHFYTHKDDDEETRARNLQALKDDEQRIQMKFGLCK